MRGAFDQVVADAEQIGVAAPTLRLRDPDLDAGIVGPSSAEDALHVALATLGACPVLVSWNFKHLVHRDKVPCSKAVNTLHDHPTIDIYSPAEVITYAQPL